MTDHADCSTDCPLECASECALHPNVRGAPIHLEEALRCFERDAVHGVCNTGRYRMRYYTWGSGPPLVFVHGVCDSSRCFLQPIFRLSEHFRCIAYDLPTGIGDRALINRYTHSQLIEDLLALIDHLALQRTYLLGSSFGSTVALTAMHRHPGRFPRAVLQGGLALRPLRPVEKTLAHLLRPWHGPCSRLPLWEKVLRKRNYAPFVDRSPSVWGFYLNCTGRTPIRTFAHQLLLLDRVDLRPILPQIRQPILMVCGAQDPVIGRDAEEVLLAGLPNAGRVVVEGCGHLPTYTHPEVLAEVTRQFLTPPTS